MKEEYEPITDDEWLLRRVHTSCYRPDKFPPISMRAFEPRIKANDPDTTGISLYREACLADPTEILATLVEDKRPQIGIVRVSVSLLKSLGLSVQADLDERVRGHVVIRELNSESYVVNKSKFKPVLLQLVEQASLQCNILRTPQPI